MAYDDGNSKQWEKFMKSAFIFLVVAVVLIFSDRTSNAKDCDCTQHKAGASGSGSCTLTEDSSRCSINFSGGSSRESSPFETRYRDLRSDWGSRANYEDLSRRFDIRIPLGSAFGMIDNFPREQFREEEFRDIFLSALATTGVSESKVHEIAEDLNIARRSFSVSGRFNSLFESFRRDGCFEYNERGFRFLLIATWSKYNGACR